MMKNYKLITRLTFVVACLMMSFGAWAQLPMTRSTFNAPFVPITVGGGATTSTIVGDDGTQTAIPIGFTFNYLGTNFTTMDLCANGWASFGAGGANSWTNNNLFTTTTPNNTIAPWWDDLNVGTGAVLYQTQGIAGSQTFTVQWDNVLSYNGSARTLTFKLVLYEGTNVIEFHYNNSTPGAFNITESASIGIEGATGGAGNFIDAMSGSSFINQSYMTTNKWLTDFIRFTPGAPTVLAGGTYTVGSTGTYPNLSEAVANINHRGISGPVVLSLIDAVYDTTAAGGKNIFPIMFGPVVGNNSVNTITVQPASGTATLTYRGVNSGSGGNQTNATAFGTTSEPIFAIVGTDYTTVKNINFQTIGNGLVDRAILVANATATDGAQNNLFENISSTLLRTNTSTIAIQQNVSTTPTTPAGANSNNTYKNLTIKNTYAGIQLLGNAANPDLNTEIGTTACGTFNSIGDAATPNDIGNGTTTTYGISASNQSGVKIYNNIIRNVTNTGGQADGINILLFQGTSAVYNNKIQSIRNAGAASTTTVTGIRSTHTTTGTHTLRVYNNSISDITSGYTGAASATRTIKGLFIAAAGGGLSTQVYEVFNNNVSIDGSSSLNISSTCFEHGTTSGPVYNIGNNVFANFTAAQTGVARHLAMFSTSATLLGNTGTVSNNNDLFVLNDMGTTGFVGRGNTTEYATLANWQTAMTQDAASVSVDPNYINNTNDLHATNSALNGAAQAPPAYITNDLDCASRTPDNDIGAYILNACSGAPTAGSITGVSSVCNGSGTTLNLTGATTGAGITYQWASSTVSGGPYTNMGTSTTQATGPLTSTTYYIVTTTCAFGSSSATAEYTLNINGLPTVTVNPTSALYCNPGTAVALTASGTATSYAWLPAAGLSATTGASVNATPATTTTYTVTGTDGNGCANTATAVITSAPAVSVSSVTATPSAICTGGNSSILANTSLNLVYCTAGATSTGFEKISNVTFGTINNTSAATAGYENFTAQSTNITAGVAVPISIGVSGAYATDDRIHIWVDMNNDGVFADPAENVLNLAISTFCPACAGTNTTVNGNITIPVSALNGPTRIRIRLQDQSSGANSTPCGTSTYGQVEDYTVNISGGTTNTNISYAWSPSTFLSSTTVANPTATAMSSTTTYTVTATSLAGCSAQGNTTVTVNPLPTVTASSDDADNTVCNGTMVTLTGGGASTYTWSGGVTDATAFAATSTTTYTVTGTDVNSCQNTATLTLTVNALPTVTATSDDADNTVCNGTMVTLTGTGTATGYTWSGGVTDATAFAATSTTTYTVTGTDGNGCMNTDMITITVNTLPTVTASSDAVGNMVCDGDMVTLTGTGTATGYTWTGGVMDATAFTPTMTDTYTVTGTDANGCMNTDMITITVNTLPTVTASSDAAGNMVCDGDMVTLTGGGATSYLWTGGVMDATAFTPTMTDTYTVTGTDANGCMNTDMITITVNTLPTVTASSDATNDEVCAGLMVTLNGGGADTYIWTGGVMDGASFAPSMTDTYTVTGTDLNGCEGTASITITVNALPTVDLAPFATSVCDNGGPVSLVDGTPTGGMFSGLGVTGSTFDPSVTGAGMWTITYTVTDGNGCNNSDSEVLTVDLCTGIASNESQVISLYPNPTTGMFTLDINNSNANQVVITILDMQGKVVFNESDKNVSTQYNKQIDLSDLAKGIYYVKLNIGADVKIEKLIVQ